MFTSSGPSGASPRDIKATGSNHDATPPQQNWFETLVTPLVTINAITSSGSIGSDPPRHPPSTSAGQTEDKKTNDKGKEAALQPQLFIKDLREGFSVIAAEIMNFVNNADKPAWMRHLIVGGAIVTMLAAGACGVATGLAAVGFAMSTLIAGLKENNLRRAASVVDTSIFSLHFAAMDCWELFVSSCVHAGRMLIQSMIPESRPILGGVVAGVGIALSASLFSLVAGVTPGLSMEFLPVITIIGRGVGAALPKSMSTISSVIGISMSALVIPYFIMVTPSLFMVAFHVAVACRNYQALTKPQDNEKSVAAPEKSAPSGSDPSCQEV